MTSAACEEEWPQKTARAKRTLKRDHAKGWLPLEKSGLGWETLKGNKNRREATRFSCGCIRHKRVSVLRAKDEPTEAGRLSRADIARIDEPQR
jgi:hypothetical protein